MNKDKETPEMRREKLRQKEIKKNPIGNVSDSFERNEKGSLVDLAGGLNWKVTGIILIVLIGFVAALLLL